MAEKAKKRIRPLDAWRAVGRLLQNPDDTKQVFEVIDALEGGAGDRNFVRFAESKTGRQVLADKRDILDSLTDRAALRALPVGSLGHSYAEFMDREQLSADGLVEASEEGGGEPDSERDPDRARFGARIRDTHDLWHVVTGYNRDLVGEAALLVFTHAQLRNRGIGLIVVMAYLHSSADERKTMRAARRRAKRALWLPAADWEALLPQPLEDVRKKLCLGEPPIYTEMRSNGAPALAAS